MSTRKTIWLSLSLVTGVVFYALIPVDAYEKFDMVYSVLGGMLFFITLFWGLGDFDSIYDIVSKPNADVPQPPTRKFAPLAVIPAFGFIVVLVFHQIDRKDKELTVYGVLAKGMVTGGESTQTTRRFQTHTAYSVVVSYWDSLQQQHWFDESVRGVDFNNVYKGAPIDVVYSRRYPSLAKAIFSVEELSKFIHVPTEKLEIQHLVAIMDGKIERDSILGYLNSINYEWAKGSSEGLYTNEKLNIAVKIFPNNEELAYIEQSNLFVVNSSRSFEDGFTEHGFKKKASSLNGESQEYYYNDNYLIAKERRESARSNNQPVNLMASSGFMVYHILPTTVGQH